MSLIVTKTLDDAMALSYTPLRYEAPYYESLFRYADKSDNGTAIAGDEAKAFLALSELPEDRLGIIWNMADNHGTNTLNRKQFNVAVRLIELHQNNQQVENLNLTVDDDVSLAPAYFQGVSGHAVPYPDDPHLPSTIIFETGSLESCSELAFSTTSFMEYNDEEPENDEAQPSPIENTCVRSGISDPYNDAKSCSDDNLYVMTTSERSSYEDKFSEYLRDDRINGVSGPEHLAVFVRSDLKKQDVYLIWYITASDSSVQRLTKLEFALAHHLINCVAQKNLPVPLTLPTPLRMIKSSEETTKGPSFIRPFGSGYSGKFHDNPEDNNNQLELKLLSMQNSVNANLEETKELRQEIAELKNVVLQSNQSMLQVVMSLKEDVQQGRLLHDATPREHSQSTLGSGGKKEKKKANNKNAQHDNHNNTIAEDTKKNSKKKVAPEIDHKRMEIARELAREQIRLAKRRHSMTSADSMSDSDVERLHLEMMCSANKKKNNNVVDDENVSLTGSEIERMHLEMIGAVPSDEPNKSNTSVNNDSTRKVVFGLLGNWKRNENGGEVKKDESDKQLNVINESIDSSGRQLSVQGSQSQLQQQQQNSVKRSLFSFPGQKEGSQKEGSQKEVPAQGNMRPALSRRASGMSSRSLDDDMDSRMFGGKRKMKKSRSNPDLSVLNIDMEEMSVQSSITNDQATTPHNEEFQSNWVDIDVSHKQDESRPVDAFAVKQMDNHSSDKILKLSENIAPPTLSRQSSSTEPLTTSFTTAPPGTSKRSIFSFIGNKSDSKSKAVATATTSTPPPPLTRTTTPPILSTATDEIQKIYENFEDMLDNDHKDGITSSSIDEAEQQPPPTPVINSSKGGIFRLISGRSSKPHGIDETIPEESEDVADVLDLDSHADMDNHIPKVLSTPDMHQLYSLYSEPAKFIPT